MPNNDYILRSDAIKAFEDAVPDVIDFLAENMGYSCPNVEKIVGSIPAADVKTKRKTGHWVYKSREQIQYERVIGYDIFSGDRHIIEVRKDLGGKYPHCSECDALAADSFMDYCPHCGAKMSGPEGDEMERARELAEEKKGKGEDGI